MFSKRPRPRWSIGGRKAKGLSQAENRFDINADDRDIAIQRSVREWAILAQAGVVHEDVDGADGVRELDDAIDFRWLLEVRGDDLDRDVVFGGKPLRELIEFCLNRCGENKGVNRGGRTRAPKPSRCRWRIL